MNTGGAATNALTDADHRSQLKRAVIASTVGTTIEWYDFLLYGQVAGLVFGKLYFPKSDPLVGALLAFSTYAVGLSPGRSVPRSSGTGAIALDASRR